MFEKEALLISLLGVALGLAIAILARYALVNGLGMNIDLEANSIIYSSVAGLGAGLLGACTRRCAPRARTRSRL